MTPDRAEEIGIRAIGFIAGNDDICPVFLGASGASLEEMRNRATETDFQLSALEFLTMDDSWVVAFCDQNGLEYEMPLQARHVLAGPSGMHWT